MNLTDHITLEEMLASQTAARMGIDNTPSQQELKNLIETANLLEAVRSLLGNRPIIISSGYRCLQLNRAIGSGDGSAHVQGKAADFTCPSFGNPYDICRAIVDSGLVFDQLIFEFNSWVHLAWDANNRNQVLTIDNNGTRFGL